MIDLAVSRPSMAQVRGLGGGVQSTLTRRLPPPHMQVVGGLVPRLSRDSVATAVSIVGANVMPHSFFLHRRAQCRLLRTRAAGCPRPLPAQQPYALRAHAHGTAGSCNPVTSANAAPSAHKGAPLIPAPPPPAARSSRGRRAASRRPRCAASSFSTPSTSRRRWAWRWW